MLERKGDLIGFLLYRASLGTSCRHLLHGLSALIASLANGTELPLSYQNPLAELDESPLRFHRIGDIPLIVPL